MIFLLVVLCDSVAMDNCNVHRLGQFPTQWQCEAMADVHREILGTGPEQNYRLECLEDE